MPLSQNEFLKENNKMRKYTAKEIGNKGEKYAESYLKKHKFKILNRNYNTRFGEIDIIAENKEKIAFVEVKTRHSDSLAMPYEAVDLRKQKRIIKAAMMYLAKNDTDKFCSFDICEVIIDNSNLKLISINYIENAFEQESNYETY